MSAVLRALVEITAAPPEHADPAELLVAFAAMFEARQDLLAQIRGPLADTEEARVLVVELAARDAAWEQALAAARAAVGAARHNAGRLRSYAR